MKEKLKGIQKIIGEFFSGDSICKLVLACAGLVIGLTFIVYWSFKTQRYFFWFVFFVGFVVMLMFDLLFNGPTKLDDFVFFLVSFLVLLTIDFFLSKAMIFHYGGIC